jgi:hypothetical protein
MLDWLKLCCMEGRRREGNFECLVEFNGAVGGLAC